MKRSFVFLLLLLLPGLAAAGNPRKLSASDAASLRGRSLTVVTHEPREVVLYNLGMMATKGEREQIVAIVGQDWYFDPDTVVAGTPIVTRAVTIPTDIHGQYRIVPNRFPDPAHLIAPRLAARLQDRLGLVAAEAAMRVPKTEITTFVVPRIEVAAVRAAAPGADVVLDIETVVWQIDRVGAFYSMWYRNAPRAAIVDLKSGKVLFEYFCGHVEKKAAAEPPYLLSLVVDDYARLKGLIDSGAEDCLAQFTKATLGTED